MSHYAALSSLMHTIKHINHHIQVSLLPRFPSMDSLSEEVSSLQSHVLKSYNGKNWNGLDEELRELTCKMEDVLESQVSAPLIRSNSSGSDDTNNNALRIDFARVEEEIRIFIERVAEIKRAYSRAKWVREQVDDSSAYSSRSGFFTEDSSELVGMQDELGELKELLLTEQAIAIVGMAGIGKTALAKAVIEDSQVWNCFDCHVFVPVGPNYEQKELLLCILSQLDCESDDDDDDNDDNVNCKNDQKALAECVYTNLKKKRYIILFDDVWDESIDDSLLLLLPENFNGSRVMLTTRAYSCADGIYFSQSKKWQDHFAKTNWTRSKIHKKQFLDKKESWDLLHRKVFDTKSCPYEFKKFGKKIAERCEGLPLAIISVGNHLAKVEKTAEYWESLAEKGIASIISADDEVFKVLHPSYQHLNLFLKALFLYLGVFPQCCEISSSKIVKLWIAEGFLGVDSFEYSEIEARFYLNDIREYNLVVVKQHRLSVYSAMLVKTCNLHIVYWCYCKTQAGKENFFQILNTIDDLQGARSKRRLCIHNNSLFGIKDFHKSMENVTNLRSLLCTGPYHKYPLSISLGLKLLKVLEAVEIRFYEFPFEVLNLVLLRYLAFTYDGNIPPSISSLISLEFLIVRRHVRIIDPRCPSYLPLEIWDMKGLRHLQVVGSDLHEPPPHAELPNLLKLLDVTPQSCTKRVLDKIPMLMKLGVQVVLPVDAAEPPCSLDHLGELSELTSLKCTVINPKPSSLVAARAYPTSIFPGGLERLSLSGIGYSWDQMSDISRRLPNLQMLKLRHCAFRGSSWTVIEGELPRVRFLLLEDIDLRHWIIDKNSFLWLAHLVIRHCYNLEQLPQNWKLLSEIETVDCKPSLVDSAKRSYSEYEGTPTVSVISSWEEEEDKN